MSFNLNELIKIRKATSGSDKSKKRISDYINHFQIKVNDLNGIESNLKKKELVKLMNEESKKRKGNLSTGVSSYADPNWSGPAACETLILCLLGGNVNEIEQANEILDDLTDLKRAKESKKSNILGYLIILVVCPLSFYFFSWWIGLIVLFTGLVNFGWKNRYD
jgi:hypothetical protein